MVRASVATSDKGDAGEHQMVMQMRIWRPRHNEPRKDTLDTSDNAELIKRCRLNHGKVMLENDLVRDVIAPLMKRSKSVTADT